MNMIFCKADPRCKFGISSRSKAVIPSCTEANHEISHHSITCSIQLLTLLFEPARHECPATGGVSPAGGGRKCQRRSDDDDGRCFSGENIQLCFDAAESLSYRGRPG